MLSIIKTNTKDLQDRSLVSSVSIYVKYQALMSIWVAISDQPGARSVGRFLERVWNARMSRFTARAACQLQT